MSPTEHFERLFSYGSLQDEAVQRRTFGRTLTGTPDTLAGYHTVKIDIPDHSAAAASGAEYYLNAEPTADASAHISGTCFEVTTQELEHADVYEASAHYHRIRVQLQSGLESWIYVSAATRK
jgi:gamma-glutamylcyclotransferase (GGCT)/AIG2-like uncharacterized protein YtfP